jgi:glutamyl-tRNA reductase
VEFLREKLDGMNHFSEKERELIGGLMDELIERLLLSPAERLRTEKEHRRKIQNAEAIRDLFLSDKDKL